MQKDKANNVAEYFCNTPARSNGVSDIRIVGDSAVIPFDN